jgi:hypothetical protein
MSTSNNVTELIATRQQICDQLCATTAEEQEFCKQIAIKRDSLRKELMTVESELRIKCDHEWEDHCEYDYYRNYYCGKCGIEQYPNN